MPSTISPLPRSGIGRIDRGDRAAGCAAPAAGGAARRRSPRRQSGSAPPSGVRATSFRQSRRRPRAARRGGGRCAARRIRDCPIFAAILAAFDTGDDLLERRIGPFVDQPGQEIPFGDRDAGQKRNCCRTALPAARRPSGVALQARARAGAIRVFGLGERRAPRPTSPVRAAVDRPGCGGRSRLSGDIR